MSLVRKKLEWLGYPTVKKSEDMFIRFDRMYERDRGRDTPTEATATLDDVS